MKITGICQILLPLCMIFSSQAEARASQVFSCLQVLAGGVFKQNVEHAKFPWLGALEQDTDHQEGKKNLLMNKADLNFRLIPKVIDLIGNEYSDEELVQQTNWQWMGHRLMGHDWDQFNLNRNPFLEKFLDLAPLLSADQQRTLRELIGDRPLPPKLDFIRREENGWNPYPLEKSLLELLIRVAVYEERAWIKLLDLLSESANMETVHLFNLRLKPLVDGMPDSLRETLLRYAGAKYWEAKRTERILSVEIEELRQAIKAEESRGVHPQQHIGKASDKIFQKDRHKDSRRIFDAFINVAFRGDLFMLDLIENSGLHPLEAYRRYHEQVGKYFPIPESQRVPYDPIPDLFGELRRLVVATFGENAFQPTSDVKELFLRGIFFKTEDMGFFVGGSVINGRGSRGSDVDILSPNDISSVMADGLHEVLKRVIPEAGDYSHRSQLHAIPQILTKVEPIMFQIRGGTGAAGEGSIVMRIYRAYNRTTIPENFVSDAYFPIRRQEYVSFDLSDTL